ncbi:MAG: segregation/condensation protein A [Candidatus Gastranaerophilales bacterium]|nr:segregation/condensation protein A [Candidatus Gastranaerophilales bacterium]
MINSAETNSRIIGTLAITPAPDLAKEAENDFINATLAKMQSDSDGIDILLEMVKKNKLDPWNIDVVQLADQYFARTIELRINNLHVTSRVILFACILLRLKSDILEGLDPFAQIAQEEDFTEDYADPEYEDNVIPFNAPSLNEVIQRRTSVRLNRKRNVTLNELISHLEFYARLDKKRSLKNRFERAKRRHSEFEDFTPEDIIEMAHSGEMEQNVDMIREVLTKIFTTQEKVQMSELNATGLSKVSVYLALLFLTADDRINLEQEEFYSDVTVVPSKKLEEQNAEVAQ